MSVKFFGQFLIELGEIDGGHLREALDLMERENLQLGELAVREGLLSAADATRVNAEQRNRDRPFGELAIELGLLGVMQLDSLLDLHQRERLPIGEALVRLGHLAPNQLSLLLDEFKFDQSPYEASRYPLPDSLSKGWLAPCVIALLPRYCLRIAKLHVKLAPGEEFPGTLEHGAFGCRVSIALRGSEGLRITLLADRTLAERIARGTSGLSRDRLDAELIADGAAEFLNVVAGNAMAVLEREGAISVLEAPCCQADPQAGTSFGIVGTEGRGALVLEAL